MRPSNILDTFRNLLKSSASMYQISGSKFFRTTTEIQSGPDAFDESSFVMTFLTFVMTFRYNHIWSYGNIMQF